MEQIAYIIRKVDFVGIQLKPTLNGQNRIKSVIGGLLSLIVAVFISIGFAYFGASLVRKDRPIMNVVMKKSQQAETTYKENPLLITMFDGLNRVINDSAEFKRAVSVEVELSEVRPPEGDKPYIYRKYYGKTKVCSQEDISPSVWQSIYDIGNDPSLALCLDKDSLVDFSGKKYEGEVKMRNRYADINSNWIEFKFKLCDETKDSGCRAILSKNGGIRAVVFQMNYYLDESDFENPVEPDIVSTGYKINQQINQSIYIYTKINEIVTDDSLFLTSTKSETYFTLDKTTMSVGVFEESQRLSLSLIFSNDKVILVNQRRYLKIPELLANLGGFLKASLFLANMLSYTYSQYIFFLTVTRIESKASAKPLRSTNNFVEKSNSAISSSPVAISAPKQNLKLPSFGSYIASIFRRNRNNNIFSKDKQFRYLELNYLIKSLLFVEELQLKQNRN